jgi:hypothetical protein
MNIVQVNTKKVDLKQNDLLLKLVSIPKIDIKRINLPPDNIENVIDTYKAR